MGDPVIVAFLLGAIWGIVALVSLAAILGRHGVDEWLRERARKDE